MKNSRVLGSVHNLFRRRLWLFCGGSSFFDIVIKGGYKKLTGNLTLHQKVPKVFICISILNLVIYYQYTHGIAHNSIKLSPYMNEHLLKLVSSRLMWNYRRAILRPSVRLAMLNWFCYFCNTFFKSSSLLLLLYGGETKAHASRFPKHKLQL